MSDKYLKTRLIKDELVNLLNDFELQLNLGELRPKVLTLVDTLRKFRLLSKTLVSDDFNSKTSARDRILQYFIKYKEEIIDGDEIMVVSGIQEYARRVRELRNNFGWNIVSGVVLKELYKNEELLGTKYKNVKPDSYMLVSDFQDKEAAYFWNLANSIRNDKNLGSKDKILNFLKANIGKKVTGEQLRYVTKDSSEWARRLRELRTEDAWPILSKNTGREDLAVSEYVLESDRQGQIHDRKIADSVRSAVLKRDDFACRRCGWKKATRQSGDPKSFLELHHIVHHFNKGENSEENLMTLCNVCHDDIHRLDKSNSWSLEEVEAWLRKH